MLLKNLAPVTVGNAIAGAFLVAASMSFSFGRLGRKGFQPKVEGSACRWTGSGPDCDARAVLRWSAPGCRSDPSMPLSDGMQGIRGWRVSS